MIATNTILAVRQLPEEFESIFREHSEFVYRTAYRVTGSAEDAEDVMQTEFLKLFRSLSPSDLRLKPRAYLYRAAVNTALNVVRSRQHQVLTDQPDIFESDSAWRQSDRDADMHENLRMALADLRPKAAEIFILRYGTVIRTSRSGSCWEHRAEPLRSVCFDRGPASGNPYETTREKSHDITQGNRPDSGSLSRRAG